MKLLLTGATGFVGRNFLLRVLKDCRYEKIYLPVRSFEKLHAQFIGDGFEEIPSSIVHLVGSARDWNFSDLTVNDVVHCAGSLFGRDKEEVFSTNVEGTVSLFKRVKCDRAVILSSQSASGPGSGESGHEVKCEADLDIPLTWYGESKLEMEHEVARQFPSLNYVVLRPSWTIGPRDGAMLSLFKMVQSPIRFKPGRRLKNFSFISVNDVVDAILTVLSHKENWPDVNRRIFFISADEHVTDLEIISTTADVSGRAGLIVRLPKAVVIALSKVVDAIPQLRVKAPSLTRDRAKEIGPDNWAVSNDLFKRSFDWAPKESLKEALDQAHEWYRKTGQLT